MDRKERHLPINDIFWGFMSSTGGAGTGACNAVICLFSVGLSHLIGIWCTVGLFGSGLSLINWLIRWTYYKIKNEKFDNNNINIRQCYK